MRTQGGWLVCLERVEIKTTRLSQGFRLVQAMPKLGNISGLRCNDGKVRGVNAGGWLLLEPWMTPRLFQEFQDEYGGEYRAVIL